MDNYSTIVTVQRLGEISKWIFLPWVVGLFCILCSTNMFAQTSKYFIVKENRYFIELTSNNGKEIVVKEPFENRTYPKSHFELINNASQMVRSAFGVLNAEQVKSLKEVKFVIVLGPHLEVFSCKYEVPVGQLTDLLKMEDKLNDLSQKYLFRNMKPFFDASNETLFQKQGWVLGNLDRLYNFDPATFPK